MHVISESRVIYRHSNGSKVTLRAAYEEAAVYLMSQTHGGESAWRLWRRIECMEHDAGESYYGRLLARLRRYIHYRDFIETWQIK